MENPLKASTAYVSWQDGAESRLWKILSAEGEVLETFPKSFTEKEMMKIVKFARGVELEAFNAGVAEGKEEYRKVYDPKIAQLTNQVKELEGMNSNLADKLQKFIIGDSE